MLDQIKKLKSHAIVVLNIPSYASGTNPWNKKKPSFDPQSMNDSKLEVIGLSTSDLVTISPSKLLYCLLSKCLYTDDDSNWRHRRYNSASQVD